MSRQTFFPLLVILLGVWALNGNGATYTPPTTNETAILYIGNENLEELSLLIKPQVIEEDPSLDPAKRVKDSRPTGWMSMKIPGNSLIEVAVHQKDLGPAQLFSVTGEVNSATHMGKCHNLKCGRTYYLRFTNNSFGTDCFMEELNGPVKNFPHVPVKGVYTRIEPPKVDGKLPSQPSQVPPTT